MTRDEAVTFSKYDAAKKRLSVLFASGRVFVFADVPAAIAVELRSANDQTRFLNERICGKFPWMKVSDRTASGNPKRFDTYP
ncbi:MAG: KTSC domain-containing protein [Dokdonella sp.]